MGQTAGVGRDEPEVAALEEDAAEVLDRLMGRVSHSAAPEIAERARQCVRSTLSRNCVLS